MPPWLLVDTQPDTLDTGVTRDTPVTGVTRDTRIPMGTGKENDAPGSTRAKRGLSLFGAATGGIAGPDCINRVLHVAIADVLQ